MSDNFSNKNINTIGNNIFTNAVSFVALQPDGKWKVAESRE